MSSTANVPLLQRQKTLECLVMTLRNGHKITGIKLTFKTKEAIVCN